MFRIGWKYVFLLSQIQVIPLMKLPFRKRKNRKILPVHCMCRNCGTQVIARYCHNCGQDLFAGSERTVGEIIYNAADTIFAWDNKIFKTLKYLVFYPGKLTKDFFAGKVIQYVYPAKLFWFITILFFAAINLGGKLSDLSGDDLVTINLTPEEEAAKEEALKDLKELSDKNTTTFSSQKKKMTKEERKLVETKVKENFADYLPYIMFLLVPFFALLLFMLFYKKKKYYASHMIFALHFHSFVFLLFTILIFVDNYLPESWEDLTGQAMIFLPAIYFIIALYVAYRPSIPKLLWKVPFIMLAYAVVCFVVLILFIILLVRIVEIMHNIQVVL